MFIFENVWRKLIHRLILNAECFNIIPDSLWAGGGGDGEEKNIMEYVDYITTSGL